MSVFAHYTITATDPISGEDVSVTVTRAQMLAAMNSVPWRNRALASDGTPGAAGYAANGSAFVDSIRLLDHAVPGHQSAGGCGYCKAVEAERLHARHVEAGFIGCTGITSACP